MNLENCRYVSDGQCTPPLMGHQNNALNILPTAKNSRTVNFFRLIHSIVAFFWVCHQGQSRKQCFRWLFFLPARNLRTVSGFAVLLFPNGLLPEEDKKLPVPFMLDDLDFRKLVHFEFLIFRRVGIIKSLLLERNVSADEVN